MENKAKRVAREQETVDAMIQLYCRNVHHTGAVLCIECTGLMDYANTKLARCPHGEKKPKCSHCEIHCYSPEKREQIRQVMKYAGPRMLLLKPKLAIRHLMD
jgi:hypothetical protein